MIALWWALAWAADPPSCGSVELEPVESSLSVTWVSRVGRSVRAGREIEVVPTAELRVAAQRDGSVARMLQRVGERGSPREPKRRWKVVIFDAEPGALCRPIAGHDDPVAVGGLVTCRPGPSRADAGQTGCGTTTDRATGGTGLPQYRGTWRDLARNGFCVLPAERFVEATPQDSD